MLDGIGLFVVVVFDIAFQAIKRNSKKGDITAVQSFLCERKGHKGMGMAVGSRQLLDRKATGHACEEATKKKRIKIFAETAGNTNGKIEGHSRVRCLSDRDHSLVLTSWGLQRMRSH